MAIAPGKAASAKTNAARVNAYEIETIFGDGAALGCGYTVRMRRAAGLVLLLGYLLCGGACSGGYPLPPTRCDEFCDATKGFECEDYYEPAACVSQCEQDDTAAEACRPQFDAAVSCFRKTPGAVAALCESLLVALPGAAPGAGVAGNFSSDAASSRPCLTEELALSSCNSNSSPFPNIRE